MTLYYDPNRHIVTLVDNALDEDGDGVYFGQFPGRDIILNQSLYEAVSGQVNDFNLAGNNAEVLAGLDEATDIYIESETHHLVESD